MRCWAFNPLAALHWQHFDGEWVIFDEGSGQTFVLDALMAAALMALESGCRTEAEISQQMRVDLPSSGTEALAEQLVQGMEFLAQLGLVEEASA